MSSYEINGDGNINMHLNSYPVLDDVEASAFTLFTAKSVEARSRFVRPDNLPVITETWDAISG